MKDNSLESAINISKDPVATKNWLNHFNKELKKIEERNQTKLEIGDNIYYNINIMKTICAKVIDIDEYKCVNGAVNVYYWVMPANILVRWFEQLRYKWAYITKKSYIPGKWFYSKSVKLGKDIFLTREDAEIAYLLHSSIIILSEIEEQHNEHHNEQQRN
jgi:hypothetical protein